MNKTELKLQVMKMKKSSMPLNHIYDYLLVQCLLNKDGLVPESVKAVERITGIIINDVRLMTCLMFYWRALSMDKRLEKCCNITEYLAKKEMGIDPGPAEGIRDEEHEKKAISMLNDFIQSIKSNPK
jgi:hypothetical protein